MSLIYFVCAEHLTYLFQYQEATAEAEDTGEVEYYDESQLPEPSVVEASDAGYD